MPWVVTKFERTKLYGEVWAEPVIKVAKRYGISDVGLRKICKRLGVPLPPAGHWTKVRAGKSVRHPDLPPHQGETTYCSNRYVDDSTSEPPAPEPEVVVQQRTYESMPEHQIVVRDGLEAAHRFVRVTANGFRKPSVGINEVIVWPSGKCVLDIGVARESQMRALLLMDALLSAMPARGFKVFAQQLENRSYSDHKYVYLEVLGERLGLRLTEKSRREERTLTPEEQARQCKDKQFRPIDPWINLPTGLFTFTILGDDRRERAKISDRKNGI